MDCERADVILSRDTGNDRLEGLYQQAADHVGICGCDSCVAWDKRLSGISETPVSIAQV